MPDVILDPDIPATETAVVAFLLDRTGSMNAVRDSTIDSFNAYVRELQSGGDPIDFTFIQFDSGSMDKIHVSVPIATVPMLTRETYKPRSLTPLIEAAHKTIKAVEDAVLRRPDKPKIVICIQTDGLENASDQSIMSDEIDEKTNRPIPLYSWRILKKLVEQKTADGWQFNFMGAGIDAYDQANQMGISAAATMSYDAAVPDMAEAAFTASAQNTRSFTRGLTGSTNYSMNQRTASGDKWADKVADLQQPAVSPAAPLPSKPVQPPPAKKTIDDFTL